MMDAKQPCGLPCDPLFDPGRISCPPLFLCQSPSQHVRLPIHSLWPFLPGMANFLTVLYGHAPFPIAEHQTPNKQRVLGQHVHIKMLIPNLTSFEAVK